MKWGNIEFTQTKTGGMIVNRPRRQQSANRIIPRNFFIVNESIITRKPHVLTVAEWEKRQRWQAALPWIKAFAVLPASFAALYIAYWILYLLSPEAAR